jgi:hypothetical protein
MEGHRRRHRTVGDVEAVLGSVRERKMEHGRVVLVLTYPGTGADGVDHGVGYSAWGIQWGCLAASWCVGESVGERREGEEDDSDEAQWCPGASRDVPVHALARLGVVTMSWPGRCLLLLDSK